jgi:hypothetical protein
LQHGAAVEAGFEQIGHGASLVACVENKKGVLPSWFACMHACDTGSERDASVHGDAHRGLAQHRPAIGPVLY